MKRSRIIFLLLIPFANCFAQNPIDSLNIYNFESSVYGVYQTYSVDDIDVQSTVSSNTEILPDTTYNTSIYFSNTSSRIRHNTAANTEILELVVYPNPANSDFYIHFVSNEKSNYNLQILDIYGRTLLNRSNKINVGMNVIGIEKLNLASGEYTIRLISGSGISKYKKLHILN